MQVIFWIMFLIVMGVAIFYWINYEKTCECLLDMERRLDDQTYTSKMLRIKADSAKESAENQIKEQLYSLVFQTPHYNSIEDLQNKIKTVLASDQTN